MITFFGFYLALFDMLLLTSCTKQKAFSFASWRAKRTITTTASGKKRVTLLPGEGIGPEVTQSVVGIFRAAGN